eukprot:UN15562
MCKTYKLVSNWYWSYCGCFSVLSFAAFVLYFIWLFLKKVHLGQLGHLHQQLQAHLWCHLLHPQPRAHHQAGLERRQHQRTKLLHFFVQTNLIKKLPYFKTHVLNFHNFCQPTEQTKHQNR